MITIKLFRGKERDLVAVILGQGLAILGAFFGVRLLTEFLSPEIYGQYKLVLSSLSLCTGLLVRPFLQYIMRAYHDEEGDEARVIFTEAIRLFFSKYVAILGIAVSIGIVILTNSFQATVLSVALVVILFMLQALFDFERTSAVTRNEQTAAGAMGASSSWLVPIGIVSLSMFSGNLTVVLLANTLILLIIYSLVRIWLWRRGSSSSRPSHLKPGIISLHLRPAFIYGWPMAVVGVLSWTVHESDRFLLSYFQSDYSVGIYSAAYGLIATPFTLIVGMAAQFLYPIVFGIAAKGDVMKEDNVLRLMLVLSIVLCVVGVGFIWFFQSQIAWLALGADYREDAVDLFVWLAAGYGFLGIAMSFDLSAYGAKKTTHIMLAYFVASLVNISLNFGLIPYYASEGAAIATMVSLLCYLLVMATLHYISRKSTPEKKVGI